MKFVNQNLLLHYKYIPLIYLYSTFHIINCNNEGKFTAISHHPLDPLSESEIVATVSAIRNYRTGNWVFNYIVLQEPEKSLLLPCFLKSINLSQYPGIQRKSFSIILERQRNQIFEVIVNLKSGSSSEVESWTEVSKNFEPAFTPDEMVESERIVREDLGVQVRCKILGWTNMSLIFGDLWSMGYIGDKPQYQGRRVVQLYMYAKNFPNDNHYAHPLDFLAVVDLNEGRVVAIEDLPTHDDFDASNKKGNSVPLTNSNFDPDVLPAESYRNDVKPLKILQPDGPSFTIAGNEIQWQKFKFRVGFNGREGLVIYHVNYNDAGRVRPLFYRMSLAETFVPYGDPRPPYHRKHAYGEGQYGMGFNAFELDPQVDCIGSVHFISAVLHDESGKPQITKRAVCVFEEDAGILWKHVEFRNGKNIVVRSRRLSLTFCATVSNYDYIYTWHFYQDGRIDFEVKLTGILSLHLLALNATPSHYGTEVFPQINAQYHQHFFCVRLDAEIDGDKNSVATVDIVPLHDKTGSLGNPYGQGFTTRSTILSTAAAGRSNISPQVGRSWHILSRSNHPYTKKPGGYKLVPWPTTPAMIQKDSPIHPQSEWMDYNTWVTPYMEGQLFPGGFYLNNSGLPEWLERNRKASIENTDLVIWHTFGFTKIPISEDFPVMPGEVCKIELKPVNFFTGNPAVDVPPQSRINKGEL